MPSLNTRGTIQAILRTGMLAGTLDILAAFATAYIARGTSPGRVLKFVASGAFGMEAFSGGWLMMLAGLALHYAIAFFWTLLFFWSYPRLGILAKSRIVSGIAYGLVIWLVMNLLVLPMTRVPLSSGQTVSQVITGVVVLMLCVGIPVSFGVHRYYKKI